MKKRVLAGLLAVSMVFNLFFAEAGTVQIKADEVSDSKNVELQTGLQRPEIVEVKYSADKAIYEPVSWLSEEYESEWDKYSTNFYYNQLSDDERVIWDALDRMCLLYLEGDYDAETYSTYYLTEFVNFGSMSKADAQQLAYIFRYSNPQYYFLNTSVFTMTSGTDVYIAIGIYSAFASGADRTVETAKVEKQAEQWVNQVTGLSSDSDKVEAIHEIIVGNVDYYPTSYTEDTAYTQSAYSVLCTDYTVCAGYAQAFEMICNGAGVDCISVTSDDHQWNKVRVDDSWYNVDCTWADQDWGILYTYFGKNDASYASDSSGNASSHTEEAFWEEYLPLCTLDTGSNGTVLGTWPVITKTASRPSVDMAACEDGYEITLSSDIPNAVIYYTLDGKTPAAASKKAIKYTVPFVLTDGQQLKAITTADGYYDSSIANQSIAVIHYKGNGAASGSVGPTRFQEGDTVTIGDNSFERPGYTFAGWNTKADGSGTAYSEGQQVDTSGWSEETTLYAQWSKKKYTITYKLNYGKNNSTNPTSYYVDSDTITLKNPTRTGYTFAGWYLDSAYEDRITEIEEGTTGNITLYAKWSVNKYKIVFKGNGSTSGSMTSMTNLSYGKTYTLKENAFKRKGYTFAGWNTKADGSGKSYTNKEEVTSLSTKSGATITLYAQWNKYKYTITYNLKGGKNNSSNPSGYYVTSSTITLKNPTKTGYTFKGWYTDSSYKNKITEIPKGSTGKLTLYAKWTANKYKITFKGNGNTSGSMSAMTSRSYGTTYTLKANAFKKKGYTFVGWNTKADGSGKSYDNKEKIKNLTSKSGGNVTLYAQWEKYKYTITYNLKGGKNNSKNPSYYYVTSSTIKLKNPTKSGYTFEGWYTDSSYKKKITQIPKGSTGKLKLYAKWKKK